MAGLFLGALLAGNSAAYAADYKIDPAHTTVGFSVRHLAISHVPGRFVEIDGGLSFDPANIKASKTEATIKTASITTQNQKRDDHLRSPDFFDVAKYPEMSFKSKGVQSVSDTEFKVDGDLTMHGITKPVILEVTYDGAAKDPQGKDRVAFSATAKVNRKDFGLNWNKVLETGGLVVGDEVAISLEIEAVKEG
jgi:polyisoprenoid-binding protein YceI